MGVASVDELLRFSLPIEAVKEAREISLDCVAAANSAHVRKMTGGSHFHLGVRDFIRDVEGSSTHLG